MLEYYALYSYARDWEKGRAPVGIIVVEHAYSADWSSAVYHAMHWDHQEKEWVYDPQGNADILSDEHNEERKRLVERTEAEQIASHVTSRELPNEDTIRRVFHGQGEPSH